MKKISSILLLLSLLLLLNACGAKNDQLPDIRADISGSAKSFKRSSPYQQPERIHNHSTPEQVQHTEAERSKKILSAIRTMDLVEKASVVVRDQMAIVGIIVPEDLPDDQLRQLKQDIETRVSQIDSAIEKTSITSTAGLAGEISDVSEELTEGVPKIKLNDELEHILTRMTPAI